MRNISNSPLLTFQTPKMYWAVDENGNDLWNTFLEEKFAPEIHVPEYPIIAQPTDDSVFDIGYTQVIKPFRIRFKNYTRTLLRNTRNRLTITKSVFRK